MTNEERAVRVAIEAYGDARSRGNEYDNRREIDSARKAAYASISALLDAAQRVVYAGREDARAVERAACACVADERGAVRTADATTCPDCNISPELGVYHSPAGFYIGTFCGCGPYSRESDYYATYDEADSDLASGNVKWRE